ncbi:MAG: hypothetical protein CME72_07920 [Halomonadaceae bacterium]|nr:hypothetical protein [Halomonadaceae bacterium]
MENLSKRDQKARQETAPGWDDRIAESPWRLNFGPGLEMMEAGMVRPSDVARTLTGRDAGDRPKRRSSAMDGRGSAQGRVHRASS